MWKALYRFVDAVNNLLRPHLIKFPTGQAAVNSANEIKKICGVPQIVGVVDGTHIPIRRPLVN